MLTCHISFDRAYSALSYDYVQGDSLMEFNHACEETVSVAVIAQRRQDDRSPSVLSLKRSKERYQNALLIVTTYLRFGLAGQRYRWWL